MLVVKAKIMASDMTNTANESSLIPLPNPEDRKKKRTKQKKKR
jgi:hypothetical protein